MLQNVESPATPRRHSGDTPETPRRHLETPGDPWNPGWPQEGLGGSRSGMGGVGEGPGGAWEGPGRGSRDSLRVPEGS